MNRIILIGNGFDLAHKMKTSYSDFISFYWDKISKEIVDCSVLGKVSYTDENLFIKNIPYGLSKTGNYEVIKELTKRGLIIEYKNKFLERLNQKHTELSWVDIEDEYYSCLKSSLQQPVMYPIKTLNKEFLIIQNLLEEYLITIEDDFQKSFPRSLEHRSLQSDINNVIYSDFVLNDFSESAVNRIVEEEFQKVINHVKDLEQIRVSSEQLSNTVDEYTLRLVNSLKYSDDKKRKIRKLLLSKSSSNYFLYQPKEIIFVSFNYTSLENFYNIAPRYPKNLEVMTESIHIHGLLNNRRDNKIIFGFGDEIDSSYNEIENKNDNDYLENIKSIKYLESDSYKKLLEFINSDEYQILIFGHSCGISDRTLLNTLFEHKNCCSIKPYYREKPDGSDNYSDIIRNISRNFTNKATMRDRVVNKVYTEAIFK
ncbi:hypothetical protein J2X97_002511 [Epilithonimonas hungarica]|uniref:AbiH family protein n=1 Tax=Epilithonimonas hungarica TaxID=454006 RepID=UPI0027834DF5|nr:AbiH family protein [Epilithonimonas hungarica]MDP9956852.1 hypothetical protein [Epilithonimonas hungarica]